MPTNLYFYLEIKDWVIVASTLLGPILAVQAQKAVESYRANRQRKAQLFERLMATRTARVSSEHVRALNMIDLIFYGEKTFGFHRRSANEKSVLTKWKEYLDHLNTKPTDIQWSTRSDDLFIELLSAIAQDLGYDFDRVDLKRTSYSPIAHGDLEQEQSELRRAALSLVTGKHALQMNVVGFPFDQDAVLANRKAMNNIGNAMESGVLKVDLIDKTHE